GHLRCRAWADGACRRGIAGHDRRPRAHCFRPARRNHRPAAAGRGMGAARIAVSVSRTHGPLGLSCAIRARRKGLGRSAPQNGMKDYERFFSEGGRVLRESPIRKMGTVLAASREVISFAPGYPANESFPWDDFRAIADDLLTQHSDDLLQYGPTRGYRPLLDAIIDVQKTRGINVTTDQVIVTTGSQQGLFLLARALFDPGDVVLVELPSYTGAITAFKSFGADLVGVAQDDDGINLEDLDRTLARVRGEGRRVKCLYLVPNFQNPTGRLLSLEKRRALVEWTEREDVLIVEDDPHRDIYFTDVTAEADTRPLAADDPYGRVLYLSSFSKTLAPGFRTAWLVAPPVIASKVEL